MTKTKSILVSAVMLAGLTVNLTANAALLPLTDYNATLVNGANSFTLTSYYYTLTSGPYSGDYAYVYQFSGAPDALSALSVYFSTAGTYVAGSLSASGLTAPGALSATGANSSDVYWQFSPNTTGATLTFASTLPAILGDASAQDGGLWGNGTGGTAYGVVIPDPPTVPDGSLTMTLLGGTLVGLGALRRKLS
jgi:hypothetical protein